MLQQTPIEIRALASPAFLERGCVNVISLSDIRAQAGDRWNRIRVNVYDRIETLLRQRLGPSDFFARIEETKYLVTMPSSEPEDVNIICMRVAYDLYTNLLGQCDVNQIHVYKAINAGEGQMQLIQIPTERMAVLAEKAGLNNSPAGENAKQPSPSGGATSASPAIFRTEDNFPAVNQTVNVHEGLEERSKTLTIVHQFVPLWSMANNAITTYICEPRQIMSLDIPRRPITLPQLTLRERIKIELTTLREGIAKLAAHIESGNRFILGMQVSFDVLGAPAGRMEYLAECRNFSNEYRAYLDFIITDVPQGIAHTRLGDLANTLRPFARSVSATVAPGSHTLVPYQGIGLRAIGFNRHEFIHEHLLHQEDITMLTQVAKAQRMGTFILGIRKLGTLQMAHQNGIQMMSGPAILPATPDPKGMTRLSWEEIISSHTLLSS